ncbi:MAG: Yip1 family protein [Candidatus Gastranaerophilales bacterium]|nr:Yip1 family protein [Candidatus Gastranaerophilales bacterium]
MEEYFKNIYCVLCEPNKAFEELNKINMSSSQAAFTIIWVNIFLYSLKYIWSQHILVAFMYIVTLFFYLISVLIGWLMLGVFFEYIAKIFDKSGNLKKLLYLSSYAVLPWIFLAPLELLKRSSDIGYFLGVILELIIYFWTMFLYAKSLEITYNLKFTRAVMLIFLPTVVMLYSIFWTIGFITKLGYIFTV